MSNRQYKLKDIFEIAQKEEYIKDSSCKEFVDISREFNKKISERILQGYKFKFGIGIISVIKDIRRGKSINWYASKKLKQQIIEKGETPFHKINAPQGKEWFIYFEGGDYFKWNWFKDKASKFVKNSLYYTFKPMTGNRKKVGKVVNNNELATLTYAIH